MMTRRTLLASATLLALLAWAPAWAQSQDPAVSFISQTTKELTQTVNGPDGEAAKKAAMEQIIDRAVDVQEVARFCLGRFWHQATPQQQQEYVKLFHRVLVNNITSKIGDYKGVSVAVGKALPREGEIAVLSTVNRPNNPPTKVDWLVTEGSSPKIIDVIAEGTSLRLTQRNDYASYLSHNNYNVQALIDAMRQQASQAG